MKVYLVEGNKRYRDMFLNRGWELAPSSKSADLIQFTGGADVNPSLYGQQQHPKTQSDPKRDELEQWAYDKYVGKKPMAGICRGAQFLWVMNGGSLYQDVDGHATGEMHRIYDGDGIEFICKVTSTHHQMMRDNRSSRKLSKLLGISMKSSYKEHMDVDGEVTNSDQETSDIEVAHFPDTKCLCFQPHPEHGEGDCQDYYFQLIEEHLLSKE